MGFYSNIYDIQVTIKLFKKKFFKILKCINVKRTYLKTNELLIKHQEIKKKCLIDLEKYKILDTEYQKEFDKTNHKLDLLLEQFKKENLYKKSIYIDGIKKNSIDAYRETMNDKVNILSKIDFNRYFLIHFKFSVQKDRLLF